jgi:CPA2 family monovalent cation:H+ antiporter-2
LGVYSDGVIRLSAQVEWADGTPVCVRVAEPLPGKAANGAELGKVIIAGFGLAGRSLVRILAEHHVPYVIVDLNPESVREASRAGEPAYYGDVTSGEVLHHLGVERARELIVVVNDPGAAERAAREARRLAPALHITVRTRYRADVPGLRAAGATEVVVGEVETAVETVRRALGRLGADPARVQQELALVRMGVPVPPRDPPPSP